MDGKSRKSRIPRSRPRSKLKPRSSVNCRSRLKIEGMKTRESATIVTKEEEEEKDTRTPEETREEIRVANKETEVVETVSISAVKTNLPILRLQPSKNLSTRRSLSPLRKLEQRWLSCLSTYLRNRSQTKILRVMSFNLLM